MMSPNELDLAKLIVDTLGLSLKPEEINLQAPLFGDGLGLDSIDGLEIGMAIKKAYGVTVDNTEVTKAFASLETLKGYVQNKMQETM